MSSLVNYAGLSSEDLAESLQFGPVLNKSFLLASFFDGVVCNSSISKYSKDLMEIFENFVYGDVYQKRKTCSRIFLCGSHAPFPLASFSQIQFHSARFASISITVISVPVPTFLVPPF
ncbi:hypothetical protein AMECASPLE_037131 [Ameca splendens]|uniref:Uncharacterized protein n=1 Tax=Ameca splendens TaxID=208324 RepID=A0ABV1A385_9TELE